MIVASFFRCTSKCCRLFGIFILGFGLGKRLEIQNYALLICCYRIKIRYGLATLWLYFQNFRNPKNDAKMRQPNYDFWVLRRPHFCIKHEQCRQSEKGVEREAMRGAGLQGAQENNERLSGQHWPILVVSS